MTITIRIDRRFMITICALIIVICAIVISTSRPPVAVASTATPCPPAKIVEPHIVPASYQLMEHGWLLWMSETNQIYVLVYDPNSIKSGTVEIYPDTWKDGMPESDPSMKVPRLSYQPVRGFGKLWRENKSVRAKLGWGAKLSEGYMMVLTEDGDKMWFNGHDQAFKITGNRWEMFWAWG